MWGAGCIFVEMMNGYPCFPGVRYQQSSKEKYYFLEKIQTHLYAFPGTSLTSSTRYSGWRERPQRRKVGIVFENKTSKIFWKLALKVRLPFVRLLLGLAWRLHFAKLPPPQNVLLQGTHKNVKNYISIGQKEIYNKVKC